MARFVWNAGDLAVPACFACRYLRKRGRCKAFPGGIPEAIITGENDHTEPYPGDNGIRFELLEDAED